MAGFYDTYYVNDTDNTDKSKNNNYAVPNRTGASLQKKQKSGSINDFVAFSFPRNYNIMRYLGLPKQLALQRAVDMTMQHGLESQYGRSKTLQKTIDAYIKAGNTRHWTMMPIRRDLEDMMVLS